MSNDLPFFHLRKRLEYVYSLKSNNILRSSSSYCYLQCKSCFQNLMEIDGELTEKSGKNNQRQSRWKLIAIFLVSVQTVSVSSVSLSLSVTE